jgi:hypothetical protein
MSKLEDSKLKTTTSEATLKTATLKIVTPRATPIANTWTIKAGHK